MIRHFDPALEQRSVGWEEGVALRPLPLGTSVPGVECSAGTDYPGKDGKHTYVVHVTLERELDMRHSRKLLSSLYRALTKAREENFALDAASRFGGADTAASLPFTRSVPGEVHCFWMLHPEHHTVVLAMRTHFKSKDSLKAVLKAVNDGGVAYHKGAKPNFKWGWEEVLKVWWADASDLYPKILGRLRRERFGLKWVQREGFAPAPPIENIK